MRLEKKEDFNIDEDFDDTKDDDNLFGDFDSDFGETHSMPMEKHSELLKHLTNFDPYLKKKFNEWLGVSWDEKKQRYNKNPLLKPVMNLNCAVWLVSYIGTYARPNNIITDISKDDYIDLRFDIIEVIWLNLGTRAEEFRLKSYGDIQRIATEAQHTAELVLMGAGDGKYNELLRDTQRSTYHQNLGNNPEQPQRSRGFFSNIRRIFGGN
jgi:hypothetical protein